MLSSFGEVLLSKRGYKSANVTTASDIDDDTKKNISELLNSQYGLFQMMVALLQVKIFFTINLQTFWK